jgi:heterodisulfide reductase subunit C2
MSTTNAPIAWTASTLAGDVAQLGGTEPLACFQCHKCSTGCPIGPDMDLLPSQVMRMIHLGADEVLQARSIWLCASCEACTTRCPMGVDVAGVMDALRILARRRGTALPDATTEKFNRSFLASVRRHGRVFELGMLAAFKLRTGKLLADIGKVPQMLRKGKIALLPHRSRAVAAVRKLFKRADQEPKP